MMRHTAGLIAGFVMLLIEKPYYNQLARYMSVMPLLAPIVFSCSPR